MTRRILHVLSQRPGWTGSGVALEGIVRAATDPETEQMVVVGTPPEPRPPVGDLPSERIRPLPFESEAVAFPLPGMSDVMPYPSTRFSEMTSGQLDDYRGAWRKHLTDCVEDFSPTLVHSHHIWLLSGLLRDVVGDVPIVTHCHGTGLRQLQLCPHLADEVISGCSRNDAFVVLHQGHAEQLVETLGVADDRVHIVGSGFRRDIFSDTGRRPGGAPAIAYAGKLSNAKGVPWLLEAVDRLAVDVPDVVLHIAGSGAGSEADAIRERIDRSPNIRLHGQLDQPGLADLFRSCDVFVLPSFYEGLPLVLVEAAACGARLVSTALPGVVNQLQPHLGDTLHLVDMPGLEGIDRPVADDLPKFVEGLAGALHAALREGPVENAQTRVNGMTWQAVFDRIERVWIAASARRSA